MILSLRAACHRVYSCKAISIRLFSIVLFSFHTSQSVVEFVEIHLPPFLDCFGDMGERKLRPNIPIILSIPMTLKILNIGSLSLHTSKQTCRKLKSKPDAVTATCAIAGPTNIYRCKIATIVENNIWILLVELRF